MTGTLTACCQSGRIRRLVRKNLTMRLLTALLACLPVLLPSQAGARDESLQLVAGQQKVISVPGVTRIAVANPEVADVRMVGAGEVLVTAVGGGQTELKVWQGNKVINYQVAVTTMDPQQLRREVERLMGDREGMQVRVVRDHVYIEGSVLTLPDLEKAEEITKLFPQVRNLVKLDPAAHTYIAQALNQQLTKAGLANARATVVGSTIFLEGMVDTEADLKKADIITKSIGENIQSVLRIAASQMIELDVEFVEVGKNTLDRMGVTWPSNVTGQLNLNYAMTRVFRGNSPDSGILTGTASGGNTFGLALQFTDGISRVLAHPRLVTASHQEAKFLAGGEIPIPIVTPQHTYVEYKEYGIRLHITPVADPSGSIQTKVLTEISQLDPSVTVMQFPGFLTRRVDTEVTVHDGETIVLSGLLHVTQGKDVTKIPILGHIPIIGELFKSRSFQERQTELVIFVTPRLVDPVSKHLKELSSEMLKKYDDAQYGVKFGLFD